MCVMGACCCAKVVGAWPRGPRWQCASLWWPTLAVRSQEGMVRRPSSSPAVLCGPSKGWSQHQGSCNYRMLGGHLTLDPPGPREPRHSLGQRPVGTLPWQFEPQGPVVGWGMPVIPLKEIKKKKEIKKNRTTATSSTFWHPSQQLYSQHHRTDPPLNVSGAGRQKQKPSVWSLAPGAQEDQCCVCTPCHCLPFSVSHSHTSASAMWRGLEARPFSRREAAPCAA